MDFFGKSDPYLVFERCNEDNSYVILPNIKICYKVSMIILNKYFFQCCHDVNISILLQINSLLFAFINTCFKLCLISQLFWIFRCFNMWYFVPPLIIISKKVPCSKLAIKTLEWRQWSHSKSFCSFIVNFEHVSHIFSSFLLLTLNK